MDILFAGEHVGESRFETLDEGRFHSTTTFAIGSTKVDGTVEGRVVGGRLVRYTDEGHQGALGTSLRYGSGKLAYSKGGKQGELAYTVPVAYAASLHPQLSAGFLRSLGALRTGEERKSSVFLLDVGVVTPVLVKALPLGTVRVGRLDEPVHRYELAYGTVEVEYDLDARGEVVAMDVPGQRLRFLVPGWESLFEDARTKHPELSAPQGPISRPPRPHDEDAGRGRPRRGRDPARRRGSLSRDLGTTPYGRDTALALADYWASRGYVYVAQDCRGRGDSEGEWDPFVHEGKDGYDAVAWVARQPWCDGRVGMIGGATREPSSGKPRSSAPPRSDASCPRCPLPMRCTICRTSTAPSTSTEASGGLGSSRPRKTDLAKVALPLPHPDGLARLPLGLVDEATLGRSTPVFQSWIRRPFEGDWAGFDFESRLGEADVPALHISGWWDGDGIGTKLAWAAMRRAGRKDQWLVYGPWSHAFNTTTRLGDEDFGPDARYDLDGLTLRFFDTFLKGKEVGMASEPRVRAFVTGSERDRWVSMDRLGPPRVPPSRRSTSRRTP